MTPRPFLSVHTSKDLTLTKDNLVAFEMIGVTVQEIDLTLTQSSFREFASMLHDWVVASKQNEIQHSSLFHIDMYDLIENLGFATCNLQDVNELSLHLPYFEDIKPKSYPFKIILIFIYSYLV